MKGFTTLQIIRLVLASLVLTIGSTSSFIAKANSAIQISGPASAYKGYNTKYRVSPVGEYPTYAIYINDVFQRTASVENGEVQVHFAQLGTFSLDIRGYRASGSFTGPKGNTLNVTVVEPPPPPSAPSALNLSKNNGVLLTWQAVSGATRYELMVLKDNISWQPATPATYTTTEARFSNLSPGLYKFQIVACNLRCSGARQSRYIRINPLPAQPAKPTATGNLGTTTLTWPLAANTHNYEILERFNGGNWGNRVSTAVREYTWNNLSGGKREYRVRACNSDGCSTWSVLSNAITTISVPAVPTKPTAIRAGTTNQVSWNVVSGAAHYVVEIKLNQQNWTHFGRVNGNNYSFTGLAEGTRTYRVQACNARGCSGFSSASTAIFTPPLPAVPSNVSVENIKLKNTLKWNAVDHADSYQVFEQKGNENQGWITAGTHTTNEASWDNLSAGSRRYTVKACNSIGCSALSSVSNTVFTTPYPTEQSAPTAARNGQTVTVSWQASGGYVNKMQLQVRVNQNVWQPAGAYQTSVTTNSWQISGGTREYRIRACNDTGCSPYSEPSELVRIPTKPAIPAAPQASKFDVTNSVEWAAVNHATAYDVREFVDGPTVWGEKRTHTHSATYSNRTLGSRYYTVRACNQDVCSDYSLPSNTVETTAYPEEPGPVSANLVNGVTELNWPGVPRVTYYQIQWKVDENDWMLYGYSYQTNYSFAVMEPGSRKYRARACNADGCSGYGEESGIIVTDPVPGIPDKATATYENDTAKLIWPAEEYATSYNVYMSQNGASFNLFDTVFSNEGQWTNQSTALRKYRVEACNDIGCSEASEVSNEIITAATDAAPLGVTDRQSIAGDSHNCDRASLPSDTCVYAIAVLENDIHHPDNSVSLAGLKNVDNPSNPLQSMQTQFGSIRVRGNRVEYLPKAAFYDNDTNNTPCGCDFFKYVVTDQNGLTAEGTVIVSLTNAAPELALDSPGIYLEKGVCDADNTPSLGCSLIISPLENDSDPEGHSMVISKLTPNSPASGGQTSIPYDIQTAYGYIKIDRQNLLYYPKPSFFNGGLQSEPCECDYIQYDVTDSLGAVATSAITVLPRDASPIAVDDEYQVLAGQETQLFILENDSDNEGEVVGIEYETLPSKGRARFRVSEGNRFILYTTNEGVTEGEDLIVYRAEDQKGNLSEPATVTINIYMPYEDPQVAVFGWEPEVISVGEQTELNWELHNLRNCVSIDSNGNETAVDALSGRAPLEDFLMPGSYVTKWKCEDGNGERYPASGFIEATLTINKLSAPSIQSVQ